MATSSMIVWGLGMPWFKRRNEKRKERDCPKLVEMQQVPLKEPESSEETSIDVNGMITYVSKEFMIYLFMIEAIVTPTVVDNDEAGVYQPDGPPIEHYSTKAWIVKIAHSIYKSYI
jgi:hypothetical protein